MQNGIQILKQKNIKVTPQRLGVYNVLFKNFRHWTAEEIHEKVRKDFPTISLGTVYSILELFKSKNIIQEIRIDFQRSSFDARQEGHHHFQCRKCKKIFDVDIPLCDSLRKKETDGHLIEDFQGYFYGICRDCRNADKRS